MNRANLSAQKILVTGSGNPRTTIARKPRLYLAGKIGKNDWRHKLIPGLRGHEWKDGSIAAPDFEYVGPFFKSCDHGCNHGRNGHGAASGYECDESTYTQEDVLSNNNAAMDTADLVFVYITAIDCFGTLVEIGRAAGRISRPRIVIAFAPGIPFADFWYAALQADAVHENVRECCLPALIASELNNVRLDNVALAGGDR